ncbi:SCO family protein [Desulfuromonas versatilis]|uniref:SCO family protein n=1 Tax=Desulfuromonas versatilis TaxID=2802975 RepID=A0ABM8HUM4_9BACT|nr:SCO family protein [Desulfuromonas versatilis]BCR04426.1 SCO family protein [Desulfuromonas versatilis]
MPRFGKFSIRLTMLLAMLLMVALCSLQIPPPAHAGANTIQIDVPDLELINQDGVSGRFISEIIGDKLTAVTFTYTTCTTICPVLDAIFKDIQGKIGEQLGQTIQLITISIDPTTDIPERLKEHSEKLGAKPGWTFLTGDKDKVISVLRGMEMFSPDIFNHPPAVFIVDGRRGLWSRLNGFPSPKVIKRALDEYLKDRGES